MTFTPEDWPRVKAVFDAALDAEPAARGAYVASACGSDSALRRQVDALLAEHDRANGFLDTPAGAFAAPTNADLIGRTIGTYRVVARIGAGGMGEVYRAHDENLDRVVAVKVLPAHVSTVADRLQRFRAEARAASSLNHPNILVVHDFGEHAGRAFMVTEYVEGETLRSRLERGVLPLREALDVALQIALALAAAHARGLVHRDIKPENVMLRADGYVKVLDFGLAKLLAAPEAPTEALDPPAPVPVMGTPRYMSPEQIRGHEVDGRSDLWSLAVTLYELVAGRPPFLGATTAETLNAILHDDPDQSPLPQIEAGAALRDILARSLEKDPAMRHGDARALIGALSALLRRIDAAASASSGPARRPVAVMPNNLPLSTTTFVGRAADRDGVRAALEESRLVTLTGPGGIGKTRLALQAATELLDRFVDGVWLVDLAPLSDPLLVAAAVGDAVGIRERPGRAMLDSLSEQLCDRALLIVLDNCEHLIDAGAALAHRLLATCADVRLLVTSREPLNVPGETIWRLRALELDEAVLLLARRGRAARPAFDVTAENRAAVEQICRRLDGLPLAIELAASRLASMSVSDIAVRLEDRFRLLTGGSRTAPPRQRTLEATVAWSYDLLSDAERLVFDRLSVFDGGWSLEAAERVCGDAATVFDGPDLLRRLVDRSLVLSAEGADGRTRYRLLETIHQFGRERLAARGESADARGRHLRWAVALAEGLPPWRTDEVHPHAAAEIDNLRSALEFACESGAWEAGLRILGSAPQLGHFAERKRLWKRLLPHASLAPLEVRRKALISAGALAYMIGEWQWGAEVFDEGAELNEAAGDAFRTAICLCYAGGCHWGLHDLAAARSRTDRAVQVARDAGNADALARALVLGSWLEVERDVQRAETIAMEGEAVAATRSLPFDLAHLREVRGYVQCLKGEFDAAAVTLGEALTLFEAIQMNCASHILETTAAWAAMTGRPELGAEILGSAERIREETGDRPRPWERPIHEVWLPKIAAALPPPVFAAARLRGARRPFLDALDFARTGVRRAVTPSPPGRTPPRSAA
jgi:non-specific serine/threonine protein kinase